MLSYTESPYKFWCQPINESEKLKEIANKIESHYPLLDDMMENATILSEGKPCVAKYANDEQWYRAVVKSCQDNEVEVLFVDYGNCDLVPLQQVKIMSSELMAIPAQAVLCTLNRIPSTLSEDQQAQFTELVDGRTMIIQPNDVNSDGALVVTLFDNSSDPKVNIAEKLCGELLEDVPAILYPHLVPEGSVDGFISLVNTVSEFYVQLVSDEEDIYKLKEDLAQYYDAISAEDLLIENPKLQMACCAKYTDDGSWYRAIITNIDEEQCTIHFIDFGNEETLPLREIKLLKEEFLALPYLALKCSLKGVEPISGDNTWSTSANDWLFEFTQDKTLQILFHPSDNPIYVTLSLEGRDIADNMISAELATRKELSIETETVQDLNDDTENKKDERLAIVAHVNSAESFYVTFADKSDDLYNFHEKLQELYNDDSEQLINYAISEKCVAKYSEDDAWYRAEVIEISEEHITIRFLDYGNSEMVKKNDLKIIHPDLLLLDPFAIECTLFELKPNPEKLKEAKSLLKLLILDTEVKLEIIREEIPMSVNVKVDDDYITAELLEGDLYIKTFDVNDLEKAKTNNLKIPLDEDTGKVKNNECSAFVHHVMSAELFYITFSDKLDELYNFHEELQQIYSDESEQLIDCTLTGKCVAKFSEDSTWYRAEVIEVCEDSATVRFLDYGNSEIKKKDDLKIILPDLCLIPPFAIACTFHRLKSKPEYSKDAKIVLEELLLEKDICLEIIGEQQPLSVNVKINGNSIASELLKSGLFVEINDVSNFNAVDVDNLFITVPLGKHCVVVSHALSPSEFCIQLCDNLSALNNLTEKIARIYTDKTTTQDSMTVAIGKVCVTFDPVRQKWARALIITQNADEIEVIFVDYGNKSCVSKESIKHIVPELQLLPFQSVKCSFGEICPLNCVDWSEEVCTFFQELVTEEEKVLTAEFQEKNNQCYIVKLFDMDNNIEDIIVEKKMASRKISNLQESSESSIAENVDIDENSGVFKDEAVFSDEAEIPNCIEDNLELPYESEDIGSAEHLAAENIDTDESSGYVKDDDISSDENLQNANEEVSLDLPFDKSIGSSEFPITEKIHIDENRDVKSFDVLSNDKLQEPSAIGNNLESSLDVDVKSSELLTGNIDVNENNNVYAKEKDISTSRDIIDELQSDKLGINESSDITDSLYVTAEDYSMPATNGNICGASVEADNWPGETGSSLQDEISLDTSTKGSLEMPCESSPKQDMVSTHTAREEKIVPGQVSYIETSNIQHETPCDLSDNVEDIAMHNTEKKTTEFSDREINKSPTSEREFDINDRIPFHQKHNEFEPPNLELSTILESSPKDTRLDTKSELLECDGDSGTGNISFESSLANSTSDTSDKNLHTSSGTSEQEHELHHKSVQQKIAPGPISFRDSTNGLCEISVCDKSEYVDDRTIEGHTMGVCLQVEEPDKKLQRPSVSAEDKIVPGQLSYFTDNS